MQRENIFFLEEMKNREGKGGNIWRRFLQKLSRILRSLSFSLGLETIANFWRVSISVSENLVSEKVSVLVSENLVSEKKSLFRFRKIWYWKKSLGIGFGQNFGIVIQCWAVSHFLIAG